MNGNVWPERRVGQCGDVIAKQQGPQQGYALNHLRVPRHFLTSGQALVSKPHIITEKMHANDF